MIKSFLYLIAGFICFTGFSQEPDKEDGGTLLRRDFVVGLNFNANAGATGWGIGFDYAVQKTYKYRETFGFTLTNIRNPKEFKIYNNQGNSRGYFYGKLYSLVSFRPTYGGKLAIFPSKRENGIEISFKWSVGPSIGLVKPVYLKILKAGINTVDERYDPTIHNAEIISSRSPWLTGLGESKLKIGGFLKTGIDFNFSTAHDKISGGEVGVLVDYFPGESLQLLFYNPGNNLYASLYLQFNLGQKLY